MRVFHLCLFLAATFAVTSAHADSRKGSSSALEAAMGEIQWGWTPKQVFEHFKSKLEDGYRERVAKAGDTIEEDHIREQLQVEIDKLRKGYFKFDGRESGYDSGFMRGEFTHHNGESMMRVRAENADDYFFFIKNKLWKRYRAFHAEVFEGASFERFGEALQKRYGKAKVKRGKPVPGADETQWYEWKQKRVWARAIDHTGFYGFYCLSLEDPRTVRKLAQLRTHKPSETAQKRSIVDLVVGDEDAEKDLNADIADRITGEIRNKPTAKPAE